MDNFSAKTLESIGTIFSTEANSIDRGILKEVLEKIVNEIKSVGDKTHAVDTKLVSKYMMFEK